MKRLIIFIVIGLLMFGAGFGGGMFLGRSMSTDEDAQSSRRRDVPPPGPIVSIGEFTSNLAGAGRHVISFGVSVELVSREEAIAIVNNPGWLVRIRNEVFMLVKDKTFDDLNSAEGSLQFAGDIKRVLNAILPDVNGEAPIVQVLFESMVLQ